VSQNHSFSYSLIEYVLNQTSCGSKNQKNSGQQFWVYSIM